MTNDERMLKRSRSPHDVIWFPILVIPSPFVIALAQLNKRPDAQPDYEHEQEHAITNTSTHHDASICFLITGRNVV
jgi:hypothetical protein